MDDTKDDSGSGSSSMSSLTLRFVVPEGKNESTISTMLSEAFDECRAHSLAVDFISVSQLLQLSPSKKHVFVMENFEDRHNKSAFEHLSKHPRCTILGPQCLLVCLKQRQPVPRLPQPMLTGAMRGLVITSTGFSRELKQRMATMVERMAGVYVPVFHDGVTHLVAEVVRSPKSEVALSRDTPVMSADWVSTVYEDSKKDYNVHATDKEYMKLICPPLKGLNICLSQLHRRDKELLKKTIENNGGIYSAVLDMNTTAILVLGSGEGEKFTYAKNWKIPCVSPNWILDSIDRQKCLPTANYLVERKEEKTSNKASTPNREDMTHVSRLDDVSMCSTILAPNEPSRIDETADITTSNFSVVNGMSSQMHKLQDEQRLRRAANILNDCVIYLSGFPPQDFEMAIKAVKRMGATSATGIEDKRITHVVTGSRVVRRDLESMSKQVFRVSFEWFIESLDMAQRLPEEDFQVSVEGNRKSFDDINQRELDMLDQYSTEEERNADANKENREKQGQPKTNPRKNPPESSEDKAKYNITIASMNATKEEDLEATHLVQEGEQKFFANKTIATLGFDQVHIVQQLQEWVTEFSGRLVQEGCQESIDFLIVPVDEDPNDLKSLNTELFARSKNVVTELWIEECIEGNCLIDPKTKEMYQPIWVDRSVKPCKDIVIGITNYSGNERVFIGKLAESLGMITQEIFAKKDKKGAKRSTHLICCKDAAEGAKYEAALKWNLPIVTLEWLLTCAQVCKWVSEQPFLVGKATCVTNGKPIIALNEQRNDVEDLKETTATLTNLDQNEPEGEKTLEHGGMETSSASFFQEDGRQENISEATKLEEELNNQNVTLRRYSRRLHAADTSGSKETTTVKETTPSNETRTTNQPRVAVTSPIPTTSDNDSKLLTPDTVDFEKLRPRKSILHNLSSKCTSYLVERENDADDGGESDRKRKREQESSASTNVKSPFYIQNMKTPETPYGASKKGEIPSAKTRKLFKSVYQDLCKIPKKSRPETATSLEKPMTTEKSLYQTRTEWMTKAVSEASASQSMSANVSRSSGKRVYKDGKSFEEYMDAVLVGKKSQVWRKWSKTCIDNESGPETTTLDEVRQSHVGNKASGIPTVVDSQGWTNEPNNDSVSVRWKDPREEEEHERMRARVSLTANSSGLQMSSSGTHD